MTQFVEYQVVMAFLEDKQSLEREDYNVPIFRFPYYTVRGGFTRSKMRITVGSGYLGKLYDAFKGSITIIHHQDQFRTIYSRFRCTTSISINGENY